MLYLIYRLNVGTIWVRFKKALNGLKVYIL